MLSNEILPVSNYQIFCDLDGVLVDFNKFAEQHIGIRPKDWELDKKVKRDFWKLATKWVKDGKPFFAAMDPMHDADLLWNSIVRFQPIILSATGHISTATSEKRAWVHNHLGPTAAGTMILVRSASDKAQHAAPNHILIDDRAKAINPWIAAGGIGILHTSAADTIRKLHYLGLYDTKVNYPFTN